MPVALLEDCLKPEQWAIDPGMVYPDWYWAWNDLAVLHPMWAGGGSPIGLIGKQSPSTHTGALWRSNEDGMGLYFDGDDDVLIYDYAQYWTLPTVAITTYARWKYNGNHDALGAINYNTNNWGTLNGLQNLNAAVDIIAFSVGGDATTSTPEVNMPTGRFVNVFGYWTLAGNVYIKVLNDDGSEHDSGVSGSTHTTNVRYAAGYTRQLGRASSIYYFGGDCGLFAQWARVLSDHEMRQIARDPYGMLRLAEPRVYKAGAAAAAGVTRQLISAYTRLNS